MEEILQGHWGLVGLIGVLAAPRRGPLSPPAEVTVS